MVPVRTPFRTSRRARILLRIRRIRVHAALKLARRTTAPRAGFAMVDGPQRALPGAPVGGACLHVPGDAERVGVGGPARLVCDLLGSDLGEAVAHAAPSFFLRA